MTYFRHNPSGQRQYDNECFSPDAFTLTDNREYNAGTLESMAETLIQGHREALDLALDIGSPEHLMRATKNTVLALGEYIGCLDQAATKAPEGALDNAYATIQPLVAQLGRLGYQTFRDAMHDKDVETAQSVAIAWQPLIESHIAERMVQGRVNPTFEALADVFERMKEGGCYQSNLAFSKVSAEGLEA